jgi:ubiquinone/menaquinone biosynthesis C-methylase UbiE
MGDGQGQGSQGPSPDRETYSLSAPDVQREYTGSRRATDWVGFFLPHLHPGMRLLDLGCGVGSITLDLAKIVAPGQVIGVDLDASQLELARSSATRRGLTNVRFEVAGAYELPFPDNTFDAALAHTLLIHLREPGRALRELRRVVRPGGVVAVSDDDFGTAVLSPADPLVEEAISLLVRVVQHNGGNPYYARHLRRCFLDAGFVQTEGHVVAADYYGTADATRWFARLIDPLFRDPAFLDVVIGQRWVDRAHLETILAEIRSWAKRPDAFFAITYCAALGWVGEERP